MELVTHEVVLAEMPFTEGGRWTSHQPDGGLVATRSSPESLARVMVPGERTLAGGRLGLRAPQKEAGLFSGLQQSYQVGTVINLECKGAERGSERWSLQG